MGRRYASVLGFAAVAALLASCSRADAPASSTAATTPRATSSSAAPASTTAGVGTTAPAAPAPTTTAPASTTIAAGPGDFGSLAQLCGPGDGKGATEQGVTDTEIHLGTMADPTNTVIPGAGQESFDIGNAFVSWCNAAGGILGRKLVLTTRDSKLFEVGARMIESCAADFMLVGNATPLDQAGVDTRLGCKLAQIPAYTVSAQAADAPMQVVLDNTIHQVVVGHWRLLKQKFPDAFGAVSFISVNGAGLDSFAKRQQDAIKGLGAKVVDFQLAPVTGVDNWRPYAQTAFDRGAKSVITLSPDIAPFVRAMGDVGWKPDLLPLGVQNYNAGTIALAKEGVLPPTYVTTSFWPFEAADRNPALEQAITLIKSTSTITPDFAHLQALSAWLLWADAAKACGSGLTRDCVINHAGAQQGWTSGGITAPVDTKAGGGTLSRCVTLLRATPDGFVLDPDVTKPNHDIFNCDAANIVDAPETYTGG